MKTFQIFDPSIKNRATQIFGGQSSGMCDWDDIKYPSMLELNEEMFSNLWSLGKIVIKEDVEGFASLDERTQNRYAQALHELRESSEHLERLTFLIGFLSSDPSIQQNSQLVGTFKGMHTTTYDHLLTTVCPTARPARISSSEPTHSRLLRDFIQAGGHGISSSREWSSEEFTLLRLALMSIVIELGLSFHAKSLPLFHLSHQGKMLDTAKALRLISEDEGRHLVFYGEVLRILNLENPEEDMHRMNDRFYSMIEEVVQQESAEITHRFDLTKDEVEQYLKFRANQVCMHTKLNPLYPDTTSLTLSWLSESGTSGLKQTASLESGSEDDFDF